MLQLIHVSKSFQGRCVLKDFSMAVAPGERLCLMGLSGSGKTTVLRLLCGLEKPDSGLVEIAPGTRFSMVFQEDRLLNAMDAVSNVALCCRCTRAEIRECLLSLGLPENRLSDPVGDFSGGMKRRVAIGRALLAPSDVLLLDEPYKGLDAETRRLVMDRLDVLSGERAVVTVTHDPAECGSARVITLR